jgi:ABC-type xylose transport system permease subunit
VWAALLGILVIQSISNGMDLLSLAFSVKFTIDAMARRGRKVAGA